MLIYNEILTEINKLHFACSSDRKLSHIFSSICVIHSHNYYELDCDFQSLVSAFVLGQRNYVRSSLLCAYG